MNFVHLEFDGAIATIMLDHPGGNRINFEMREEILHAVERVAASDARVLLVKGKGADFCLGGDIRDWPTAVRLSKIGCEVCARLASMVAGGCLDSLFRHGKNQTLLLQPVRISENGLQKSEPLSVVKHSKYSQTNPDRPKAMF